jgi:hypothetical protein
MFTHIRRIGGRLLLCASLGLALAGLGCSDSSTDPNGNGSTDPVPAFTLRDINTASARVGQDVSVREYQGSLLVLYFVQANCPICRAQWAGMVEVVDSLRAEGWTHLSGMALNHPLDEANWGLIGNMGIDMPVLQDTLTVAGGTQVPAVGSLLQVSSRWHDLYILDRQQILRRRAGAYTGEDVDLTTVPGRETLRGWIEQVGSM